MFAVVWESSENFGTLLLVQTTPLPHPIPHGGRSMHFTRCLHACGFSKQTGQKAFTTSTSGCDGQVIGVQIGPNGREKLQEKSKQY